MLMSHSVSWKQRLQGLIPSWYSCRSVSTSNGARGGSSSESERARTHTFLFSGPLFCSSSTLNTSGANKKKRNRPLQYFWRVFFCRWVFIDLDCLFAGHWNLRTTSNLGRGVKRCGPAHPWPALPYWKRLEEMDLLHRFCSSQFEASSWVCVCYDVFAHFNVKKSQWLSQTQGCEICHPHLTHHPLKERWAATVLRLGSIGWSNQCQAGRQWGPLLH